MTAARVPGEDGLIERVPFLARLEKQDRSALLALGREMTFQAHSTLLHQHEPSHHVLLVQEGWTKVTGASAGGYEALLALRGPGDIVGEHAALNGQTRSATVVALEPVRAVAVTHARFMDFLRRSSAVGLALAALTSDRRAAADERSLKFASMSVKERLALLLLELARTPHGRRTDKGVELVLPLSKEELARAVGASREMVQRLLKELRERDVVITGRRSLLITRPDVLRRIARAQHP
ncbi:Crp/Fnr family transcriptional regulator [Streptomyces sp. GC420]|uniref:Crp/Fnr family transcriptional regulator n=1 Tax=Streptomyces sp. GC420 TaxID=2697568 RepID=UPI001414CC7F|nr:Crp/Fnr family transcriptional regulator [Streptomyces sp. GC420]NBM18980.1 cyclic nucleotide-binding domain-containing protein [Streptomyces sp. GC420]